MATSDRELIRELVEALRRPWETDPLQFCGDEFCADCRPHGELVRRAEAWLAEPEILPAAPCAHFQAERDAAQAALAQARRDERRWAADMVRTWLLPQSADIEDLRELAGMIERGPREGE